MNKEEFKDENEELNDNLKDENEELNDSLKDKLINKKDTVINKEDGVTCPICFGEYTSSGDHRMASMKCGHLFGHSCILEWYGNKRVVFCPICAVKCLKSQIRLIFSSRVVALNTEKEHKLIEQYLNEFNAKNKLIQEVANLKAEIEVLKLNNLTGCECTKKRNELTKNISFYSKIKCTLPTKGGIVIYDEINAIIILSAVKDNKPCLMKYYDSGITSTKTFNEAGIISQMKYIDGNVILSIGPKIFIVNAYNCNIIFKDINQYKITAIEGSPSNRNKLILGDDRGNITLHTLGFQKKTVKICNVPIHSIFSTNSVIYIGTVFNVYKVIIDKPWDEFVVDEKDLETSKIELNLQNMVCINIFGEGSVAVVVFRNKINRILHYHIDETQEKAINIGLRQFTKYKELLCGGIYYLMDQGENKVISVNSNLERMSEFQADEPIVSYDVKNGFLVLLSEQFLYVYK